MHDAVKLSPRQGKPKRWGKKGKKANPTFSHPRDEALGTDQESVGNLKYYF